MCTLENPSTGIRNFNISKLPVQTPTTTTVTTTQATKQTPSTFDHPRYLIIQYTEYAYLPTPLEGCDNIFKLWSEHTVIIEPGYYGIFAQFYNLVPKAGYFCLISSLPEDAHQPDWYVQPVQYGYGYTGPLRIVLNNYGNATTTVHRGHAIATLTILPKTEYLDEGCLDSQAPAPQIAGIPYTDSKLKPGGSCMQNCLGSSAV